MWTLLNKANLIFWATFLCCFAIKVQAQTQPLNVVTLEYPPYIFDNQGKVDGMATKVVEEAFHRLQIPIEIQILPWARAIHKLRFGQADAIYTIFKNQERMMFADYSSQILFQQSIALFTSSGRQIDFNGQLSDLSDYSFCVVIGVSYGKKFDEAVKSGKLNKIFETRSARQCLQLLLKKRVDIWINNHFGGLAIANAESSLSKIHVVTSSVQSTPSYIAFSKLNNHQGIRDKLDQVLQQMKQDGTYQRIVESFIGPQKNIALP